MVARSQKMRIVLFWFILMFAAFSVRSQIASYDIRFHTFTIDDGLTQNMVRSMLVDKTGFLWIGTSDGLNRFDGTDFVHFRHDPDNPASLPANQVFSLFELASSKGLFKVVLNDTNAFDSGKCDVRLIKKYPAYSVGELARTMVVRVSGSGNVYMGCNAGLFLAKANNSKSEKEEFRKIDITPVSQMAIDRKERVWYGASRLKVYRPIEGSIFEPIPNQITEGSALRAIKMDLNGAIWVSIYNFTEFETSNIGLYRFDTETLIPDQINGSDVALISLAFTKSDLIWGGTPGYGLKRGDLKSANFTVHKIDSKLDELRNPKSGASFFIQKGTPCYIKLPTGTYHPKTYYDAIAACEKPLADKKIISTQSYLPAHISMNFSSEATRDENGHYWVFENQTDGHNHLAEYDPDMNLIRGKDFDFPPVALLYIDSKEQMWISMGQEIALRRSGAV